MTAIANSIHKGEGSLGEACPGDDQASRLAGRSGAHRSEQTLTSLDENLAALWLKRGLFLVISSGYLSRSRSDGLSAGVVA